MMKQLCAVSVLLILPLALSAQTPPPNSWAYRGNTGKNGVIAVNVSANPRIGNQSLPSGDAIGVFFRRNDSLICAGYSIWQGQNMAIAAWGDDDQTVMKDGFAEAEVINYQIWDAQGGKGYPATVLYMQGSSTFATNGIYVLSSLVAAVTRVEDRESERPVAFSMSQNFPNPFNPTTAVSYQLSAVSFVTLQVFDLFGREVAVLVNDVRPVGIHTVRWDASALPTGVYFCRFRANGVVQTRRMMLLK
jgi:hypothetical protein